MPDNRVLVERFYSEIWNRHDNGAAEKILAADFRFRGSLGSETIGISAFLAYVDRVHTALDGFRCTVEEMISDEFRASARMRFSGRHRAPLLGVPATGRDVSWAGAAFFTIEGNQIASLWVLGDIEGLRRQLEAIGDEPL